MNLEQVKELLENQNKAWDAFMKSNDERITALEKGKGTGEKDAELQRINQALTDANTELRELRKEVARKGLNGADVNGAETPEVAAYRKDVFAMLRTGRGDEEAIAARGQQFLPKNAMTTDTDGGGGYILDPTTTKRISDLATVEGALGRLAEVVPTWLYEDAVEQETTTAANKAEKDEPAETLPPTFKHVEIKAEELYAEPRMTQRMLDIRPDTESYISGKVASALAKKKNVQLISGNGVKQHMGLLSYSKVANASYAWGNLGYIASGASGAFASSNASDKLIDLVHALKAQYRRGASFLMADLTVAEIRKLKDGQGNYLWKPGFDADAAATILGKPVEVDDNMPVLAANSYSIAFGNFFTGYKIVRPGLMRVVRDALTAKPYVKFYTTEYEGGGVANFEAIKLMKFAGS